jgi:4-hydroxymandelate oxidase
VTTSKPDRLLVNLFDYQDAAEAMLPRDAFDYIAGGVADEVSLRRDRRVFDELLLRPRMMVDVSRCDTTTTVLSQPVSSPILVAPSGDHGIAHPDGERATVRGAGDADTLMVVSSGSSFPLEDIAASATGPLWFHLGLLRDRGAAGRLIERAEAAGYRALCLTVDHKVTGLRERNIRNRWVSPPPVNLEGLMEVSTADWTQGGSLARRADQVFDRSATWDYLEEIAALTSLPLVAKGILRGDDALAAVRHGAAAVVVSDHGARQLDTTVSPIDALPEVVAAVDGRAEVYVDGGFRRGTDVLKALALGARAVLIGRPVVYGLAVGGADGVSTVLRLLRAEFETAMAMCGAAELADITPDLVVRRH